MSPVLRTFINLLLAVSLATMPVSVALSSVNAATDQAVHSENTEPCLHAGQEQAAAEAHVKPAKAATCSCCVDDCSCLDSAGCHHATASPITMQLTGSMAVSVMPNDRFITIFSKNFESLSIPPDAPPPVL